MVKKGITGIQSAALMPTKLYQLDSRSATFNYCIGSRRFRLLELTLLVAN
jgi:hypothetical protein